MNSTDNLLEICNITYQEIVRINGTLEKKRVFWSYSWRVAIAVCSVGIIVDLYFLFLCICAISCKSLPKRRYTLLINVSVSEVVMKSALIGLGILVIDMDRALDSWAIIALGNILELGFWIYLVTYVTLNTFQFIAVQNPLYYKTRITTKHCLMIILATWVLGIPGFAVSTITFIQMKANAAAHILNTYALVYIVLCVAVVVVFLLTVCALTNSCCYKGAPKPQITKRRSKSIRRLGFHITLFLICFFPIMGYRIYYSVTFFPGIIEAFTDKRCFLVSDFMSEIAGFVRSFSIVCIVWFSRSIIDTCLHIFCEPELKKLFWSTFIPSKSSSRRSASERATDCCNSP